MNESQTLHRSFKRTVRQNGDKGTYNMVFNLRNYMCILKFFLKVSPTDCISGYCAR